MVAVQDSWTMIKGDLGYSEAIDLVQKINNRSHQIASYLRQLRERRGYIPLGFDSFDAFLRSDLLQSSRTTLYRMMKLDEIKNELVSPIGDKIPDSHYRALSSSEYDIATRQAALDITYRACEAQGVPVTADRLRSVADVILEARRTGCTDLGDGEATPFTAALTVSQSEDVQRAKQAIHDSIAAKYEKLVFLGKVDRSGALLRGKWEFDSSWFGSDVEIIIRRRIDGTGKD